MTRSLHRWDSEACNKSVEGQEPNEWRAPMLVIATFHNGLPQAPCLPSSSRHLGLSMVALCGCQHSALYWIDQSTHNFYWRVGRHHDLVEPERGRPTNLKQRVQSNRER